MTIQTNGASTAELAALEDRLTRRIAQLESLVRSALPMPPVSRGDWQHLEHRPHPWRRQLSLKGRNMTVRQLLSTIGPSNMTPEQAAEDLGLPVEAIREALRYAEENAALLELETAYERFLLAQKGYLGGPRPVSG